MPETQPSRVPRIFISYRRADSQHAAGRVNDRLIAEFGKGAIFFDVDGIAPGADFRKVIDKQVAESDCVIAVIGPNWLGAEDQLRRIDRADDFVRLEIQAALIFDTPLYPLLIDGMQMPTQTELPPNIAALASRSAVGLRHTSFHADLQPVIQAISKLAIRNAEPKALSGWDMDAMRVLAAGSLTQKLAAAERLVAERGKPNDFWLRGTVLEEMKRTDMALADFTHAIEMGTREPKHHASRARIHKHLGNYPAALSDLTHAIELSGDDDHYLNLRAEIKELLGDTAGAVNDTKRASVARYSYLIEELNHPSDFKHRAGVYLNLGEIDKALRDLDRIIARWPTYSDIDDTIELKSDALKAKGDRVAADFESRRYDASKYGRESRVAFYSAALEHKACSEYFVYRAVAYQQSGQVSQGLADLNQALTLDPNCAAALDVRIQIHKQRCDWRAALEDMEKLLYLEPRNRGLCDEIADVYLTFGNVERAEHFKEEAERLLHKRPPGWKRPRSSD
jgi:tetratricopeptide (TPR) repeat protein